MWSQAKFADNGTFELDIYPFVGSVRTEFALNTTTLILDGQGAIRDEFEDSGVGTTEQVEFEGFVVERFTVVFVKKNRSVLTDHLHYPQEIDPADYDIPGCLVTWRAPGDGVPCTGPTGSGGICKWVHTWASLIL
ncbi:MAG: hypothetical protein ACI9R7_001387 [Lysobacterales bacterium]